MPASRIRELAAVILTHAHDSLRAHLEIGRVLAVEFYADSYERYQWRSHKLMSVRGLQRHLQTNYDMPRSFSSIAELIGVHFQEPMLNLAPEEKFVLSWSSRVALLRLHAPADKQKWAREAVLQHWSASELARRIRAATQPSAQLKPVELHRLNRIARRMQKELSAWKGLSQDTSRGIEETLTDLRKLVVTPHEKIMALRRESIEVEKRQKADIKLARIKTLLAQMSSGACTQQGSRNSRFVDRYAGPEIIVINEPLKPKPDP